MSSRHSDSTLLNLLVDHRHLTENCRNMVDRFSREWNVSTIHALLITNLMTESAVAGALSTILQVDRIHDTEPLRLYEPSLQWLPFQKARDGELIFCQRSDHKIDLIMADPTCCHIVEDLGRCCPEPFVIAVTERSRLLAMVDRLYPLSAQIPALYE